VRLVVTGARGQVGFELARSLMPLGEVIALDRSGCDLAQPGSVAALRTLAPDVIVNAAAYTAVDRAEDEPATAHRINAEAVAELAEIARECGALLVHFSTDYVFDGSGDSPRNELAEVAPLGVYGRSKLAGERAIVDSGCDHLVFRTSWVFAARGGNFVRSMLRLGAEREQLKVVDDQIGAPTWARNLADATAHAVRQAQAERAAGGFASGLYHLASAGETSWCRRWNCGCRKSPRSPPGTGPPPQRGRAIPDWTAPPSRSASASVCRTGMMPWRGVWTRCAEGSSHNLLRGRIAALRGARMLAYQSGMYAASGIPRCARDRRCVASCAFGWSCILRSVRATAGSANPACAQPLATVLRAA
jgi:dTDP-4-dehydrorhamnose reductase